MQIMGHSSMQTLGLLLLVLAVTVPTASAQGRSKIRIVEIINECTANITKNLGFISEIVATTPPPSTTPAPTTTPVPTTPPLNGTENDTDWDLLPLRQGQFEDDGFWPMIGRPVSEPVRDDKPTLDCQGNANCDKLVMALDETELIIGEVNDDAINEGLVDRMYAADANVTDVYSVLKKDVQLEMILHDNLDYIVAQTEILDQGKADVQALYEKMKTSETLGMVLGMLSGLLVFIVFTTLGYKCYQKTRKDEGVPEGLIIE